MLIVKTVLCEFALAARNDSSKPQLYVFIEYWLSFHARVQLYYCKQKQKLLQFERHRHADFANRKVHNVDRGKKFPWETKQIWLN